MAKKIFILSTSSLLSSENSTERFGNDNEIVVPFRVINDLSKEAENYNERGRIARKILTYLTDKLDFKKLTSRKGVIQSNGSILRLETRYTNFRIPKNKIFLDMKPVDKHCLQIALGLKEEGTDVPIILVTKNNALRLNAQYLDIQCENFKEDIFPSLKEQYTGRIKCYARTVDIITFYNKSFFEKNCIIDYEKYKWHPNLFLEIKGIDGNDSALARYDASQNRIVKLNYENYYPYSQAPKNVGQKMAIEALLEKSDKSPLVIIKGCAGTGKTFQTLAVALEKTLEQNSEYNQILITSPTETVGQENLGFLPGDIEEKYNPHLGGIRDNLRILLSSKKDSSGKEKNSSKTAENKVNALFSKGIIQIQPIGFLRGRTIVDTIFIIDETQNIDPHDIKSIVSRAGKGSKFVFLGDPSQIDNPHLNENYNGLVYISEKMKGNDLAWQVTLTESESVRSDLAKLATIIL